MKATKYFKQLPKNLKRNEEEASKLVLREMLQDSDRYVPHDTGKTRLESKINETKRIVSWSNEYVEFIFWGIYMNFQKTNNSEAQSMWTDRATERYSDKWAEIYSDTILKSF